MNWRKNVVEYRRIRLDDEIIRFCLSHNIQPPEIGDIIFAAYDDGVLVGVCGLKVIYQVEPLIAPNSPIVAQVLGEKVLAVASMQSHRVTAIVKSEKKDLIEQLERYGFIITDKFTTILKKEL